MKNLVQANSTPIERQDRTRWTRFAFPLAATVVALLSSGCAAKITGGGKICSADPGSSAAEATLSINLDYALVGEGKYAGNANLHDHGTGFNAKITFSFDALGECLEHIGTQDNLETLAVVLLESLVECVNPNAGDETDLAFAIGRYSLRGPSAKAARLAGKDGAGCLFALYFGPDGNDNDAVVMIFYDDTELAKLSDTVGIGDISPCYFNCSALKGGNITVDSSDFGGI